MYQQNLATEREGMQTIIDFFTLKSMIPPKLIENEFAQQHLGDLVVFGKIKASFVEVKIEAKASPTNSLFVETAGNDEWLGLPGKGDRALGWLYKCQADLLAYYFIESDELIVVSMPSLRDWLLNRDAGKLRNYPEVKAKDSGRNNTYGRLVKIADLRAAQLDGWWESSPLKELNQHVA